MAYCTQGELMALLAKLTITDTSSPNTAQVDGFIEDVGSEMETVLSGAGFVVTLTDPTALAALSLINRYGAAAITLRAAFPGSKSDDSAFWEDRYQRGLARIQAGKLPGMARAGVRLPDSGNRVFSETYPDSRFFKMGTEQW